MQGEHSGLSVYNRATASEAERNATFSSVGILLPQGKGELAQIWLYAKHLERLAKYELPLFDVFPLADSPRAANDGDIYAELDWFWNEHKTAVTGDAPSDRADLSTQSSQLPDHHPAHSMLNMMESFGPLIFTLYRAALLRHRILIIKKPPVETACNMGKSFSNLSGLVSFSEKEKCVFFTLSARFRIPGPKRYKLQI